MRWLRHFTFGLIGLAGVFAGLGWYLVWRSLPPRNVSMDVAGISAPVEILWTDTAIPHIFGQTDEDTYFGLGYAHALDRLWQMEMFRRTAQGRLSELFGPATLATDELLRRLDLYGSAKRSVSVQEQDTRRALDAYAAGVNARLAETTGWGQGAPEFLLFPVEIEPWRPADSIAIMKLLALQLASHVDHEVLRARVSRVVSPERLRDILPDDPTPGIERMFDYSSLFPGLPLEGVSHPDQAALAATPAELGPWASNAWAAGATRTVSGKPLLANDPHLDLTVPSPWYLARLELSSGAVIGGTIPGIPAVLSGRNPSLAWGVTAANVDDQDVFIEKLNPDNPAEVLTPEGYKPLRTRKETIAVRGHDPVEIELHWSDNGPVIPGKYYHLGLVTPPGHVAAIARTLFDRADTSLSAAQDLMAARSVEEAIAAGETFVAPAQNLTVADERHIGLQVIGKIPRRVEGSRTLGRMPSQGWIEANRWHGMLDYQDNPRFVDPRSGVIGNTNNKTVERPFPRHVSFEWHDTQRIHRLEKLLRSRDKHDRGDFIEMQSDVVSYPARTLVPILLDILGPQEGKRGEALDMLAHWDFAMDADRPEPLIYALWILTLQHDLSADELGPLVSEFRHADPVFIERVLHDADGAAAWCDDVRTAAQETCADTIGASLDATLALISEKYGSDLKQLEWGNVHVATHVHQALETVPLIGRLVSIRQPSGGGDYTLRRGMTRGTGPEPMENVHASVYRSVVDMGDPEASVFVTSTGQSGHPLSRHYRDLGRLWLAGKYVPMVLDEARVQGNAVALTRLIPLNDK